MIRAVVFDVGYTLIDEARDWREWAQRLEVDEARLLAELEAVIAARAHHRTVFARLRPQFDLDAVMRERALRGGDAWWRASDLYPDARAALSRLRSLGVQLALAGNQPAATRAALDAMQLDVDWIANSAELGVEKPHPGFFAALAERCGLQPEAVAYVGDRLDNDVLPAQRAGMCGVFLRRGPWGRAHAQWPEAALANCTLDDRAELPAILALVPRTDAASPPRPSTRPGRVGPSG